MNFKPIKPQKVSIQIAEQLRASILAGEFAPGEKLPPERELAEMFSVSRPSVRDALNLLASSGMLSSYQGGGTVVASLVETAVGNPLAELIRAEEGRALDVLEVRKCMESWTAYYAAQRATPQDMAELDALIQAMERNLEGLKSSAELDASFHIAIAKAAGNVVWLHLMQTLFDGMKEFQRSVWRAMNLTDEDHRTLLAYHRDILEAIRARDAEAARAAMDKHLTFAELRSSAYVAQRQRLSAHHPVENG